MSRDSMDREVAEKVMGWRYVDDADEMDLLEGIDRHKEPPDKLHRKGAWFVGDERKACVECGDLPEFSTRIDHAWEALEHAAQGQDIELSRLQPTHEDKQDEWYCGIGWGAVGGVDVWRGYGEAETAPLAICRAALEAVKPQ